MAYKMNGFSGFKAAPTKFKLDGGIPKGTSTNKRKKIGKASKFLKHLRDGTLSKETDPFNRTGSKASTTPGYKTTKIAKAKKLTLGLDFTLNDKLNEAVRNQKPLSKPVVKNVGRGLKTFGRAFGMAGAVATIAPYVVKGAKAVMPGLKKRAKKELKGGSMYTSSKL